MTPEEAATYPWLAGIVAETDPETDSWPRLMTRPLPGTVGSTGEAAIRWIYDTLGIRLRWWQRLAIIRQHEVDAQGRFTHRVLLFSTPRRAGKSTLMRSMAEHRLSQADAFGEVQLVMHTASDLNIAREVILRSMRRDGAYPVTRRANGQEEIGCDDGSRWLVRAGGSVYGYDICLALADECWDVSPTVVDDGLAPAMLGRVQPQMLLTSTAHRKATRLMPDRIAVLERGPRNPASYRTLGLVWGAHDGDDPSSHAVWRAAAPYWSEDYLDFISEQWERVLSGAPSTDIREAEPIEAFRSQYLNIWTPFVRPDNQRRLLSDWGAREMAPQRPEGGGVAVIDESRDGSRVGVLWLHGDTDVYYTEARSLPDAVSLARGADDVVVGLSLAPAVEKAGLDRSPIRYGAKESRLSTPLLMSGTSELRHDHGAALLESGKGAVVSETESGFIVSARGSTSDILPVKLLGWALWYRKTSIASIPMIY